jgi:pimeloyl-ACP methyl ester carboxylesterase
VRLVFSKANVKHLLAAPLVGLLAAQTPPSYPGVPIPVGGHMMHIHCIGPESAGPTVILEAGGGGSSSGWSRVQELLAPRVRSCAYDRAGSGASEPGPAPRTMKQEVFELHALLEATSIRGPFVLVGQSIGGLLVRLYTEKYGNDVVGLVLVDPTHESAVLYNLKKGGWVRLRELATDRVVPEPRLEGKVSTEYNPDEDYLAEEFQQIYLSRQANPQPLGNRPLIVLAAGKQPAPPGTSEDLWNKLKQEKDEQKADLARLSSNSKLIRDPSSGHNIHTDNPPLVAGAIEQVLGALSKGARLVEEP